MDIVGSTRQCEKQLSDVGYKFGTIQEELVELTDTVW